MRRALFLLGLVLGPHAALAEPVSYRFAWEGGGGYAMSGALSFDPAQITGPLVREDDVQCFEISGFRDGEPIGQWSLDQLTLDTHWTLNFDPATAQFVVWGPGRPVTQAWNMSGWGYDCGEDGFGFNIGNAAQDLCVGNRLLRDSQAPPDQPFPAVRDDSVVFRQGSCIAPPLLSLNTR